MTSSQDHKAAMLHLTIVTVLQIALTLISNYRTSGWTSRSCTAA